MRCLDCGTNYLNPPERCGVCNALLRPSAEVADQTPTPLINLSKIRSSTTTQAPSQVPAVASQTSIKAQLSSNAITQTKTSQRGVSRSQATRQTSPVSGPGGGDCTGRIIALDRENSELPDFDGCLLLARLIWLFLLILSPFLIFYAILAELHGLMALLIVVAFLFAANFLIRFIMPTNLFALLYMWGALNPLRRGSPERHPVRFYRLRKDDGSELEVRLKGILTAGSFAVDDKVTLWGNWKQGVLFMKRGFNHRTSSWVEIQKNQSWIGLTVALGVVLALAAWLSGPISFFVAWAHTQGIMR